MMQNITDDFNGKHIIVDVYLGKEYYSCEEEDDLKEQSTEPYVIADIYLNYSPLKEISHPNEPACSISSPQVPDSSLLYKRLTEGTCEYNRKNSTKKLKLEPTTKKPNNSKYVITYKCIVCSVVFTNFTTYQLHLNEHSHLHSFTCSECPERFCNKPDLEEHMRKAHSYRVYHRKNPSFHKRSNF